jgi:hypothetical protein
MEKPNEVTYLEPWGIRVKTVGLHLRKGHDVHPTRDVVGIINKYA